MAEQQVKNDDLYNIRQRMSANREQLRDANSKYLDMQAQHNELLSKVSNVENVLSSVQGQTQLTFEDFSSFLSEWCSSTLQPVLDELCEDLEKLTRDSKEYGDRLQKLEKNVSNMVIAPVVENTSDVTEKKTFAGKSIVPKKRI